MKKMTLAAILTAGLLLTGVAHASTGYNIFAVDLQLADGTLAPQNSMAVLVIDTANDGFSLALNPGAPLTLGSTLAGNEVIVGVFDLMGAAQDGFLSSVALVNYTGGITAGDPIGLYWFPTILFGTTSLSVGDQYGFYTHPTGLDGSEPWILPPDTGASGLNLIFLTESQGGSNSDLLGRATFTVIPEPSSIALAGIGLLGLIGLIRRRRK